MADAKSERFLTIIMGVSAFVVAVAAVIVTIQLGKVSELASDIRATTNRIDQIYPTLVSQANDVGAIKGDLTVAASKISDAADRIAGVTKRLDLVAQHQETQTKQIDGMITAVNGLKDAVAANQTKLDTISENIILLRKSGMLIPNLLNGLPNAIVASDGLSSDLQKAFMAAGYDVVIVKSPETWANVPKLAVEKGIDPGSMWIGTGDAQTAKQLIDISKSLQ